jgi:hypothetical protein
LRDLEGSAAVYSRREPDRRAIQGVG